MLIAQTPTTETQKPSDDSSKPAATQHVHNWKNVYRTEDVYETRPVYENKPVYEETPVYETHWFCNCSLHRDMTAEYADYQKSGGTYSFSEWAVRIFWKPGNDHYYTCSGEHDEDVIVSYDKIQVGTEKVQTGTEKVQVGTEQVKTGTKQVYDHKECTTCGARG